MAEHIYGIAVGTGAHLAISGRRRKFRHICQPVVINGGIFIVSPRRRAGGGGRDLRAQTDREDRAPSFMAIKFNSQPGDRQRVVAALFTPLPVADKCPLARFLAASWQGCLILGFDSQSGSTRGVELSIYPIVAPLAIKTM